MLASTQQKLEDEIIYTLSVRPNVSAAQIYTIVQGKKRYSIQGIHKELRKLESYGVVVKRKKLYSLCLPWVLSFESLAQQVQEKYILQPKNIITLPKKGAKHILHFSNLLQLNNYWAQVLIHLIQNVDTRMLCSYMPHPWFHLVYTDQEKQYIEAVQKTGTALYILNRSKTYLDQWAEKFWQKPEIEYSFSNKPFKQLPPTIYLNTIGGYVLTVKLGAEITSDIERLYTKTKSSEDIDYSEIFRVFNQRVKATLWLENNEKKAKSIEGVFRRHFGIRN